MSLVWHDVTFNIIYARIQCAMCAMFYECVDPQLAAAVPCAPVAAVLAAAVLPDALRFSCSLLLLPVLDLCTALLLLPSTADGSSASSS